MPTRPLDLTPGIEPDPDADVPKWREIEPAGVEPVPREAPKPVRVEPEPYLLGKEVAEAVNIAKTLGRPLLLQGDPGCGKTQLAHAVAYRLGWPLERATIKSTSRGQDLLYTFDAVRRLYEAQLPGTTADRLDPRHFVRLGPFGRAIVRASYGRPSVVLIDEIDKADLDFPNDLLHELDRLEFDIAETGESFAVPPKAPELRPLIFVTNNEEKALPPAFLRRCVYLELRFPAEDDFLRKVLAAHDIRDKALVGAAVKAMLTIRGLELTRKPGISELIDWARVMKATGTPARNVPTLPSAGALLKTPSDQNEARRALAASAPKPRAATKASSSG